MSCVFFKQKTAYEMRISDWSSDVCSSDLGNRMTREIARQQKLADALERTQIQISGGKKLLRMSDDPVAARRIATIGTTQASMTRSEERRVGKSVSVRVDIGGRRNLKNTITSQTTIINRLPIRSRKK